MVKSWQNQKFHAEAEFLKNHIDHSVNISVFELEAAERKITKHMQRSSFGSRFMHMSSNIENYENNINHMHTTKEIKKELQLITNLKPYIDAEGIVLFYCLWTAGQKRFPLSSTSPHDTPETSPLYRNCHPSYTS